jgi:hypothetical protein
MSIRHTQQIRLPRMTLIDAINHEPDTGQQQRYDSRSNYHETAAPPQHGAGHGADGERNSCGWR